MYIQNHFKMNVFVSFFFQDVSLLAEFVVDRIIALSQVTWSSGYGYSEANVPKSLKLSRPAQSR